MKPEITNMCFVLLFCIFLTGLTVLEVKVKTLLTEEEHRAALLQVRGAFLTVCLRPVHILALHAKCT